MPASKIRTVLEGCVKYRDGKKWKKRYCVLSLSPSNQNALHLYITKSYDEFKPYRIPGAVLAAQLPPIRKLYELPITGECKTGTCASSSSSILNNTYTNQIASDAVDSSSTNKNDSSNQNTSASNRSVVNRASHSCALAAETTTNGLTMAFNLATTLNGPAPVDEIIGFESGYHMDRESNIIVLIGGTSVYIFALPGMDEMFRWADTLSMIVVDTKFRVALRHSGDGSKLSQGIQGSLHVQHWRLCLIGEPPTGCKFICSWRLDHIEKAYTMTAPSNSVVPNIGSVSVNSDSAGGGSSLANRILNEAIGGGAGTQRGFGSNSSSSCVGQGNLTRTNQTGSRNLFCLECNHSAGKGRGSYVFEVVGGNLDELTVAINQLMALRFNPDLKPATAAEASRLAAAKSGLTSGSFSLPISDRTYPTPQLPTTMDGSRLDGGPPSLDLGVSSSFSSDECCTSHSASPAQRFQTKGIRDYMYKLNDVHCSTLDRTSSGMSGKQHQRIGFGQSVPLLSSNPCRTDANQLSFISSSSLSPPDLVTGEANSPCSSSCCCCCSCSCCCTVANPMSDAVHNASSVTTIATNTTNGFHRYHNHNHHHHNYQNLTATTTTTSHPQHMPASRVNSIYQAAAVAAAAVNSSVRTNRLLQDGVNPPSSNSTSSITIPKHSDGNQFDRNSVSPSDSNQQRSTMDIPRLHPDLDQFRFSVPTMDTTMHLNHPNTITTTLTCCVSSTSTGTITTSAHGFGCKSNDLRKPPVHHVDPTYEFGDSFIEPDFLQDTQVAKVAAGLIIPKIPNHPQSFSTIPRTRTSSNRQVVPSLPTPSAFWSNSNGSSSRQKLCTTTTTSAMPTTASSVSNATRDTTSPTHHHHYNQQQMPNPNRPNRNNFPTNSSRAAMVQNEPMQLDQDSTLVDRFGNPQSGVFAADEDFRHPSCTLKPDAISTCGPKSYQPFPKSHISDIHSTMTTTAVELPSTYSSSPQTPNPNSRLSIVPGRHYSWLAQYDHLYSIYRNRLRQYHYCLCSNLNHHRSLSMSNGLQLIRSPTSNDPTVFEPRTMIHLRSMRSLDSCISRPGPTDKLVDEDDEDDHSHVRNQSNDSGPTTDVVVVVGGLETQTTTSNSTSFGGLGKFSCGTTRFHKLQKFFHRKHSQSHDDLQLANQSSDKSLATMNKSCDPVQNNRYPNPTAQLGQIEIQSSDSTLYALVLKCPRHGLNPIHVFTDPLQDQTRALNDPHVRYSTASPPLIIPEHTDSTTGSSSRRNSNQTKQSSKIPRHSTTRSENQTTSSSVVLPSPSLLLASLRSNSKRASKGEEHAKLAVSSQSQTKWRHPGQMGKITVSTADGQPTGMRPIHGSDNLRDTNQYNRKLTQSLPPVTRSPVRMSNRHRNPSCLGESVANFQSVLSLASQSCSEPAISLYDLLQAEHFTMPLKRFQLQTASIASLLALRSYSRSSSVLPCAHVAEEDPVHFHHQQPKFRTSLSAYKPDQTKHVANQHSSIPDEIRSCHMFDTTDDLSSGSVSVNNDEAHSYEDRLRFPIFSDTVPFPHASGGLDPEATTTSPENLISLARRYSRTTDNNNISPSTTGSCTAYCDKPNSPPACIAHAQSFSPNSVGAFPRANTLPSTAKMLRERYSDHGLFDSTTKNAKSRDAQKGQKIPHSLNLDRLFPLGFLRTTRRIPQSDGMLRQHRHRKLSETLASSSSSKMASDNRERFDPVSGVTSMNCQTESGSPNYYNMSCTRNDAIQNPGSKSIPPYSSTTRSITSLGDMPTNSTINEECEHPTVDELHPTNNAYVNLPTSWSQQQNKHRTTGLQSIPNSSSPSISRATHFSHNPSSTHTSAAFGSSSTPTANLESRSYANLEPVQTIHPTSATTTATTTTGSSSTSRSNLAFIANLMKTHMSAVVSGQTHKGDSRSNAALLIPQSFDCHFPVDTGIRPDVDFFMPAEVEDPSRNYAMVDLRPSPANSTHPGTELTIVHNQTRHHALMNTDMDSLNLTCCSTGSSSLGPGHSTSTGSDCTSDAATLTSDNIGSYASVCVGGQNNASGGTDPNGRSGWDKTDAADFQGTNAVVPSRRRHSHSLSSVTTDTTKLNYVDVIALHSPCVPNDSTSHSLLDPTTILGGTNTSGIGVGTVSEPGDSPSSSSGLGGIASHSITPPLAPTSSTSFGDIFSCRSMTSSATSSGEGNALDMNSISYSPPTDHGSVAYTEIDFARTIALNQLSGDMIQDHESAQKYAHGMNPITSSSCGGGGGTGTNAISSVKSRWSNSKGIDRSALMRLIRRDNRKKTGSSLI